MTVNSESTGLVGVPAAADYLSVSEGFVWKALKRGDIPRVTLNRRTLIRKTALDAYIASHES
jgi:excisionase family DNA binding protein